MLSFGIELSRAFWIAVASAALDSGSGPPSFAATRIARDSFEKSWPRFASAASDVYKRQPKDNIERAIQRGAGGGEGEQYESILYEGYAPGGVAVICTILTDNRNRTASDLRFIFTKNGGSLGTPGSVAWQFDRKGVVMVDRAGVDEDELMEVALTGGAEDISEDGEQWQITTEPADFMPVREALEEAGIGYVSADLTMVPKSTVEPSEKEARQILRLIDALEENDDVQDVYSNFDISEELLEAVAG